MIELVKKAMFTGIGVMSLTKDKVEEVAREFVDKGKLSEKEGKKLVQEMMDRSEESKNELKKQIESVVKATMSQMDIASKTEIEALRKEIKSLRSVVTKGD